MICSFVELVSCNVHYFCKPTITEEGPLVIQGGRHIVLMSMEGKIGSLCGPLIPNDTFISPLDNFQIITGTNGSGYVGLAANMFIQLE